MTVTYRCCPPPQKVDGSRGPLTETAAYNQSLSFSYPRPPRAFGRDALRRHAWQELIHSHAPSLAAAPQGYLVVSAVDMCITQHTPARPRQSSRSARTRPATP